MAKQNKDGVPSPQSARDGQISNHAERVPQELQEFICMTIDVLLQLMKTAKRASQEMIGKGRSTEIASQLCTDGSRHFFRRLNHAFFSGIASVFEIYPTHRSVRFRASCDDRGNIASDWCAVGDGIRRAMIKF